MIKMIFPEVKGSNLEKKKYNIPQDLEGKINVVTIAFQQWQQGLVNTWVPYLEGLKESYPELYFYEFPAMSRRYKSRRFLIDGGMRMGIPDKKVRARTITLYLDKKRFMKDLNIENDDNIVTFLLDSSGKILARVDGDYSIEKSNQLTDKVKNILVRDD
jgi:hypothetical protein